MIEGRTNLTNKGKDYWQFYFNYKDKRPDLYSIAQKEILKQVNNAKNNTNKFIDSQQLVSVVLTTLGSKHNFHRQFDETFPFKKNQILGMQLYETMLQDDLDWMYNETQHQGHKYEHATYFIPKEKIT